MKLKRSSLQMWNAVWPGGETEHLLPASDGQQSEDSPWIEVPCGDWSGSLRVWE